MQLKKVPIIGAFFYAVKPDKYKLTYTIGMTSDWGGTLPALINGARAADIRCYLTRL